MFTSIRTKGLTDRITYIFMYKGAPIYSYTKK